MSILLDATEWTDEQYLLATTMRAFLRTHASEIGRADEAELYIKEAEHLEGSVGYWVNYFDYSTAKEYLVADFDFFIAHIGDK
jgi:hypothetical protein